MEENGAQDSTVSEKRTHKKRGGGTNKMRKKTSPKQYNVAQLVMALGFHGYQEQLAWLEAYLRDEARDRAMDGQWG